MENKTIHLKYTELETYKDQKNWLKAITIAHEIEASLLKQTDGQAITQMYLTLSDLYFEQSNIANGLKYLTLSESIVLQLGNWQQFVLYTDIVIRHHLLHFNSPELEQFIEKVVPIAFENEQYEMLSHCFIIQSYLHLMQKNTLLAIQEAKMAYFYAKLVGEYRTTDFSDTAKLLLVLALIEETATADTTYYIEEFHWQSTANQNHTNKLLLECIQSMILLLNHQFSEGLALYSTIFKKFLQSSHFMRNALLFEQMQSTLKKVAHLIVEDSLIEINALTNQLNEKFSAYNEQLSSLIVNC